MVKRTHVEAEIDAFADIPKQHEKPILGKLTSKKRKRNGTNVCILFFCVIILGISLPHVSKFFTAIPPPVLNNTLNTIHPSLTEIDTSSIQEYQEMLLNYYGSKQDIVSGFFNDQYDVMVDKMSDRLAHSILTRRKIVIGCIGSSVMAGHDNCHYDSFPSQLQRTLDTALKNSGISAEVRNAGITGVCKDSFQNRLWCNNALVGDADAVIATWGFFGMDAWGSRGFVEAWIKWTLKTGAIPLTLKTGAAPGYEIPAIQSNFGKYGFSYFFVHKIASIHEASTAWGEVGDGLHSTTRYAVNESDARKKSLGVMNRNWHPGPLAFQYASDLIFFLTADAIKLAIEKLAKDEDKFRTPMIQNISESPVFSEVAEPFEGTDIPFCMIGEEPTYGTSKIKLLNQEEVSEKFRGKTWERWFGAYERKIPGAERSDPKCAHIDRCGGWKSSAGAWISFEIPKLTKGVLAICGMNVQNAEVFINEKNAMIGNSTAGMHGKCKQVLGSVETITKSSFKLHIRANPSGSFDDIIAA